MTLFLFSLLLILFILRTPIAIAIGVATTVAFLIKGDVNLMLVVQRMYAGADSFPLMAVPLFMLAGMIMEKGGVSKRIINFADALVGWLPGGLAAVAVVSAMFFAGISGSAAADTAAVGGILIPAMIKNGYPKGFASAVQAAGGSIGVIIPPSIPMIIFGAITGVSIGRLFLAGIFPGILMGLSLIVVAVFLYYRQGSTFGRFSLQKTLDTFKSAAFALGAPVLILGGILGGVFTATESAAVVVVYAMFAGLVVYREFSIKTLPRLLLEAAVISSVIMFIIAQAQALSWFMTIEEIPGTITQALLAITHNPILLLLLINAVLLCAGMVLETTAALILFVPVIMPILPNLGIDPIHLGALIVINLAIGMLTPPLGICLIVSCSIAENRLEDAAKAVLPFLLILLLDLMLITFWTPLTMYLPGLLP